MYGWSDAGWRKSSYSPDWDDCVELAHVGVMIGIRDSKDCHGPVLEFTQGELSDLVTRVKTGELGPIIAA